MKISFTPKLYANSETETSATQLKQQAVWTWRRDKKISPSVMVLKGDPFQHFTLLLLPLGVLSPLSPLPLTRTLSRNLDNIEAYSSGQNLQNLFGSFYKFWESSPKFSATPFPPIHNESPVPQFSSEYDPVIMNSLSSSNRCWVHIGLREKTSNF